MIRSILAFILGGTWIGVAGSSIALDQTPTLTVMAHSSFDLSKALIERFEQTNHVQVRFISGGDAGQMLSRLMLTKESPIADLAFGIDTSLAPKAFRANIFEPYRSPQLERIPAQYRWTNNLLTPIDYGFIALNIDRAWFERSKMKLPSEIKDLAKPEYSKLLVVENPATSSPGLGFYLATLAAFGNEPATLEFWRSLRQNGAKITNGWTEAYNIEFTRNGGSRPIVLSYSTSPAAEVFSSKNGAQRSPTSNLFLPGSVFMQTEGIGILKGTSNRVLAERFIEFLLSNDVQSDFPTRMWVYPVNPSAQLHPVFRFAERPGTQALAKISSSLLERSETLVQNWTRIVLRSETR